MLEHKGYRYGDNYRPAHEIGDDGIVPPFIVLRNMNSWSQGLLSLATRDGDVVTSTYQRRLKSNIEKWAHDTVQKRKPAYQEELRTSKERVQWLERVLKAMS